MSGYHLKKPLYLRYLGNQVGSELESGSRKCISQCTDECIISRGWFCSIYPTIRKANIIFDPVIPLEGLYPTETHS